MAQIIDTVRNTISENLGGAAHGIAKPEHQFSYEDVPDQSGKVAVVTGGTEGIGYATAHTLLSKNIAHLHILSPSEEAASKALESMGTDLAKRVTWHQVDLSDWEKVQTVGKKILDTSDRLDILVNNAGRGIMTFQVDENTKLDRHMAINHMGHVVLTSTLLPLLKSTAEKGNTVRISNQASNLHTSAPSDVKFADLHELNRDLGPNAQYGRSKLANILYARYLADHLTSSHPNILANATHPGIVATEMSTRDIHEPYPIAGYGMSTLLQPLKKDQWDGAASTLFAATKTDKSGQYICPPAVPEAGSAQSNDKQLGETLMEMTQRALSQHFGDKTWEFY